MAASTRLISADSPADGIWGVPLSSLVCAAGGGAEGSSSPPSPGMTIPAAARAATNAATAARLRAEDTPLRKLAALDSSELVDAALMPPAFELGLEPDAQDLLGQAEADDSGAE